MKSAPPRAAVALLVLLAVLTGCSREEEPRLVIVHRLVDPEFRDRLTVAPAVLQTRDETTYASQVSSVSRIPVATIAGDSRSVLATFPVTLGATQKLRADDAGWAETRIPLGPFAAAGGRMAVVSHARVGKFGRWERLPVSVVPFSADTVDVKLQAGKSRAGETIELFTRAYPATTELETRIDAPALTLPAGAQLDLSFGVLEAAYEQGPVRFSVEACTRAGCEERFAAMVVPLSPEGGGWREHRIDLAAFAGQEVALRFVTSRSTSGAFSLPVWGDPRILAPAAAEEPAPPSFVVLSVDTLGRGHLDLYGYERETAPFLRDGFAEEGLVFDDLVAEAATTDPSHMTMFTALPAAVHGVRSGLESLRLPVTTLAERLREHGYETAALTEGGPLARTRGFGLGFDRYLEVERLDDYVLPVGQAERIFTEARTQLERFGERPFFLFLHTYQVHAPYAPPPAYENLFPAEPGTAATAARAHDQEIRFVDAQLEGFTAWLEERELPERTYFLFLSDHGEQFMEHGMLGHATPPFEEVLRVPLVVTGPGVPTGRSEAPLSHQDLPPTLLELAGAPPLADVSGRSFAPLLRGDADALPERPRVSASWALPPEYRAPALAARHEGWKLLRVTAAGRTTERLFDLGADPREQTDLAAKHPDRVRALARVLSEHEVESARLAAVLRKRGGAGSPAPVPLDPEREETLRALGYIE